MLRVHAAVCDPISPQQRVHSLLSYANSVEVFNKIMDLAKSSDLWKDMATFLVKINPHRQHNLNKPHPSDNDND